MVSQGGGERPEWSPDGSTLYYWMPEGPNAEGADEYRFMAARIQWDPTPVVLSTDSLFTADYLNADLHPDGNRIIATQLVSEGGAEASPAQLGRLILVQNFFEELRQFTP